MADDGYGDDSASEDRLGGVIPADVTSPREIRSALIDYNPKFARATDSDLQRLAGNIAANHAKQQGREDLVAAFGGERDPRSSAAEEADKRRSAGVFGPESDRRQVVRDEQGKVLGNVDRVRTWTDRWGNLMGENPDTGRRAKIRDKDDR